MKVAPVGFRWQELQVIDADGEIRRVHAMVPHLRYHNLAARQYHQDEDYVLAPIEERSMASHNQFFAALSDGFKNLPEKIAARWPTVEHFRAWCLIETGWFDEKEFKEDTEAHAKALATFIRTQAPYARIFRNGTTVLIQVARSQSRASMKKDEFEKSKRDVLDLVEGLIGVEQGTLMREGGRNA